VRFADRADAGRRLADVVRPRIEGPAVVLAIPRGGVIVGAEVARALDAPLEVVVPRKLGAPGNPELGIGAVAPGVRFVDPWTLSRLRVPDGYLEREVAAQEAEIARREEAYRRGRPRVELEGRVAIVVDDGIATGATAIASIRWARASRAERVVLAVPVAPRQSLGALEREADAVIALATPEPFLAVGEWYENFEQTTDDEVLAALGDAAGHAA